MCTIPIRSNIRTIADIKNLITAVILRQKKSFSEETIIQLSKYYLEDAKCDLGDDDLKKMVESHLDLYYRNHLITCQCGIYSEEDK